MRTSLMACLFASAVVLAPCLAHASNSDVRSVGRHQFGNGSATMSALQREQSQGRDHAAHSMHLDRYNSRDSRSPMAGNPEMAEAKAHQDAAASRAADREATVSQGQAK